MCIIKKDIEAFSIEKKNIINIFKLVVKDLIQLGFLKNGSIDKQSSHFISFFEIFDNIINHGYKGYYSYFSKTKMSIFLNSLYVSR